MEIGIVFVFIFFIVVAIGIRMAMGGLDRDRVREYVESRGGKVIEANWAPFGPGWFGEKSDRLYEVRYIDSAGNVHHAHCKTSMWTGVYFTEDRIVGEAETSKPKESQLEEENRRLRGELERLKGQQSPDESFRPGPH